MCDSIPISLLLRSIQFVIFCLSFNLFAHYFNIQSIWSVFKNYQDFIYHDWNEQQMKHSFSIQFVIFCLSFNLFAHYFNIQSIWSVFKNYQDFIYHDWNEQQMKHLFPLK